MESGAGRARRRRAQKVITSGLQGSHQRARPPPVQVPTGPSPRTRAAGRNQGIARLQQESAERDAAEQRETDARSGGGPGGKVADLEQMFGKVDDVCVGLLKEGKVPEALQYLEKLRTMIDTICTQLEPKVAPKDRLTLPQLTPHPPSARRGAQTERVSLTERTSSRRSDGPTPTPRQPKDGPRRGDDFLLEQKEAEAKNLRGELRKKEQQVAEQEKQLEGVDERVAKMKEKMARIDTQAKLNVKTAQQRGDGLASRVKELEAEVTTLRDRYAETAAVVGVEYVEKVDMAQQNNNAEWEEKILELAAAEQTIDHLQEKYAAERKRGKFLKQKLASYEEKEKVFALRSEQVNELHERLKALGQEKVRISKKLSLREEQLKQTSAELSELQAMIDDGRGAGEALSAENKALKDKLEATLAALAAKKSRLRKLEKRLNGGIGGIGGGGGAGSAGVSGGDYKALQAELAGFVNLLGDSAETAAT